MDETKLDASLANEMSEPEFEKSLYSVTIRTQEELSDEDLESLKSLGVRGVQSNRRIFTAEVDARTLSPLTDCSAVQQVSLGRKLKTLD